MGYRDWYVAIGGPFVALALLCTGIADGGWLDIAGGIILVALFGGMDVVMFIGWVRGREDLERAKHWSGD